MLLFILSEAQFESARIVRDITKFNIAIANLRERYIKQVENIVLDPPMMGLYDRLKNELIKRQADSDSTRVQMLLEEMGDRTLSQG